MIYPSCTLAYGPQNLVYEEFVNVDSSGNEYVYCFDRGILDFSN